ncbi:MAG: aspartate 1-decarboxylase [Methylophilaceae bacterium]|jgi:aspartate 1-decarboxylase|nr:aspartate 1-decarboxylase [Methylophilaceae bacterium]NCV28170.1 aspartate 1-decarboxylase [Nitrosomonadales bacterium]NCV38507.1 aspartate 1-decarboxylase [Betaproteobacteria bacterium]NCV54290.1 aspartate 1-decarboxylase [Betaproteobacteria bacterium]NCW62712.1 aspartate 1-decarboxylase [Betaproteobacteria bacterium]
MLRRMLKSKLHRVTVTHSELEYEGSCAIDINLLKEANINEYEQIAIYNITNGERFTTYAISAEQGSGIISINGAAAHKANPGDMLIIATYADYNEIELEKYSPSLVYVDSKNNITITKNSIDIQAA